MKNLYVTIIFLQFSLVYLNAQNRKVHCTWYDDNRTLLNEVFYDQEFEVSDTISSINTSEDPSFFFLQRQDKGNRYKKYSREGQLIVQAKVDRITKNDSRYRDRHLIKSHKDGSLFYSEKVEQLNEFQENWQFFHYENGGKHLYKERLIEYDSLKSRREIKLGLTEVRTLEFVHPRVVIDSLYNMNSNGMKAITGLLIYYKDRPLSLIESDYFPKVFIQKPLVNGINVGTEYVYCDLNGELSRIVNYSKNGKVKDVTCFTNSNIKHEKDNVILMGRIKSVRKGKFVKIYNYKNDLIAKNKIHKFFRDRTPDCYCRE